MLPPDVGCFRANALMASNQAVDSSKVTALPGRGRQPQPHPGGPTHLLPPPRPCPTCYPGCKEVSSPAPAAPAMGIDTGLSAYSCSRTPAFGGPAKPPQLQPGLTVWVPGKGSAGHPSEKAGTRGHRGAQSQCDPVPVMHRAALASGYGHPGASVTLRRYARTRCTSQHRCMTRDHAAVHEAMLQRMGLMRCPGLMRCLGLMPGAKPGHRVAPPGQRNPVPADARLQGGSQPACCSGGFVLRGWVWCYFPPPPPHSIPPSFLAFSPSLPLPPWLAGTRQGRIRNPLKAAQDSPWQGTLGKHPRHPQRLNPGGGQWASPGPPPRTPASLPSCCSSHGAGSSTPPSPAAPSPLLLRHQQGLNV